jgi:hypothetical protein
MRRVVILFALSLVPAIALAQGDGPPLKFVELTRGVYTFKRGAVVVKASCDYSVALTTSGREKKMEHFCPLNVLPGDSIPEGGLYRDMQLKPGEGDGDTYSLSNEYVVVTTYRHCASGERCVDHRYISREVWFKIVSMKKSSGS